MQEDRPAPPSGLSSLKYSGMRRKLVLAFDVGTTNSGISYCILDPGELPSIKSVTQFPAQETTAGACKIPTLIYYDQKGEVKAVGAEATKEGVHEQAMDEDWTEARWFKLHLRSKFGNSNSQMDDIPPLPPGKSAVLVMSDFLSYLAKCTGAYLRDTMHNGAEIWQEFQSGTHFPSASNSSEGIFFVLSHPNGWECREQTQMREAAVKAGLVPDTSEGHDRIMFVTEGEASLHYAVQNGLLLHVKQNQGIVVVDAGGGTIDVSTYQRTKESGASAFEEIAEANCYFQGSVFVTLAAKEFLQETLKESDFIHDVEHIVSCFDKTTKLRFADVTEPQYIKFGGTRDNDAHVNIRFGQMKIAGTEVAKFFRPAIDCITKVVLEQKSQKGIRHVLLVGGFACSGWLFDNVRNTLAAKGMTVVRPESLAPKVVSDGAISFYLDHYVRTRVSKVTYGVKCHPTFNKHDPEHLKRSHKTYTDAAGKVYIRGGFSSILIKGTQVKADQEFSRLLSMTSYDRSDFKEIESYVVCYRGANLTPMWMDVDSENYHTFFRICGDLSSAQLECRVNAAGQSYYILGFEVVILFGLTEVKAHLRWYENGVKRTSPAWLIHD